MTPTRPPTAKPLILFENDRLIVVQKWAGELVHNSAHAGPKEVSLRQRVGAAIGRRVFPVHRLDRGTSGAVLFARERPFVAPLQAALSAGEKRYVAFVRGHFFGAAWVDHALSTDAGTVQSAYSSMRGLARSKIERVSAMEILLVTGRTHQARRHLKHLSHPILGDVNYGKGPFNRMAREKYGLSRLALHAHSIAFDDDGELRLIRAPFPEDFERAGGALFGPHWHDVIRRRSPAPRA